eukprot:scaffold7375_cov268-Pinguiococcus_pyrenoidosus.AAC.27
MTFIALSLPSVLRVIYLPGQSGAEARLPAVSISIDLFQPKSLDHIGQRGDVSGMSGLMSVSTNATRIILNGRIQIQKHVAWPLFIGDAGCTWQDAGREATSQLYRNHSSLSPSASVFRQGDYASGGDAAARALTPGQTSIGSLRLPYPSPKLFLFDPDCSSTAQVALSSPRLLLLGPGCPFQADLACPPRAG